MDLRDLLFKSMCSKSCIENTVQLEFNQQCYEIKYEVLDYILKVTDIRVCKPVRLSAKSKELQRLKSDSYEILPVCYKKTHKLPEMKNASIHIDGAVYERKNASQQTEHSSAFLRDQSCATKSIELKAQASQTYSRYAQSKATQIKVKSYNMPVQTLLYCKNEHTQTASCDKFSMEAQTEMPKTLNKEIQTIARDMKDKAIQTISTTWDYDEQIRQNMSLSIREMSTMIFNQSYLVADGSEILENMSQIVNLKNLRHHEECHSIYKEITLLKEAIIRDLPKPESINRHTKSSEKEMKHKKSKAENQIKCKPKVKSKAPNPLQTKCTQTLELPQTNLLKRFQGLF